MTVVLTWQAQIGAPLSRNTGLQQSEGRARCVGEGREGENYTSHLALAVISLCPSGALCKYSLFLSREAWDPVVKKENNPTLILST